MHEFYEFSGFTFKTKSNFDAESANNNIGITDSIVELPFKFFNYLKSLCVRKINVQRKLSSDTPSKYENEILTEETVMDGELNHNSQIDTAGNELFELIKEEKVEIEEKRICGMKKSIQLLPQFY